MSAATATMKVCVLGAATLLFGCVAGASKSDDEAPTANARGAETVALPVLSFGADWSVKQTGTLVAGGRAVVHYDVARLPRCRTRYMGHWAWDIELQYAVDGGFARAIPVTQENAAGDRVGIDVTIDLPLGRDLAVWFHSSDEGGCQEWDSDYGRDFHFAIDASAPVLHFHGDWSTTVEGAPKANADLVVDYDLARLGGCRATYNGYATWDVLVDYRFDDGPVQQASLTTVVGFNGRTATPARLHAPDGARALTLWFENEDRTGCHGWDSAYGANYRFSLR